MSPNFPFPLPYSDKVLHDEGIVYSDLSPESIEFTNPTTVRVAVLGGDVFTNTVSIR